MRKLYTQTFIALFILSFFSGHLFSQCTLFITANDSSICAGDSVTLTANTTGAAASLTTVMVSNNGGSAGGTNLFDLTVAANPITITGLDINSGTVGGAVTIDMYTRPGTYVGFTASMAGWTLVGTATGPVSNGQDVATPVTFAIPVTLNAATTYGVAFIIDGGHNFRYTNGDGTNQAYSNADLSLSLGSAGNVPWTTVFTPRVWNGTIHYGNPGTLLWSTGETTPTITVAPNTTTTYSCTFDVPALPCTAVDSLMITVDSLPVVALGNDTAVCSPAVLNLDAGNAGASFAWSVGDTTQTISVSSSGNYSVDVTNIAGCTGSDTINLTFNTPPVVALGNDTTLCSGDSIILDAGNAGATYNWSFGGNNQMEVINSLLGGFITVDVTDANSCVGSDSITVSFQALLFSLGSDVTICEGSTTVLDAGPGATSYAWSEGASTQMDTVTAGNYSATITNAIGCSATDTVSVTFENVVVSLGGNQSICEDASTVLDAGAGASYLWSDGNTTQLDTVSLAGDYSVTITTALGCSFADTVTISIDPKPVASFTENTVGVTTTFTNTSTNGTSYAWDFGDGGTSILQNPTHTYADGSFTVTLIVTNACGSDTTSQNITILGMDESSAGVLTIFPNPANEFLHIHFSGDHSGLISVALTDATGHVIFELQENANEFTGEIDLKDFSSGVYFVNVRMEGRSVFSKLIVE